MQPQALTHLLEIVRRDSSLRCVVLNACFTASQAKEIAQHVDCVIGMQRAIDDRAAVAFAVGFYRALALGRSIRAAFDLGRNEIELRNLPDKDVPVLIHRLDVEQADIFFAEAAIPKPDGLPRRTWLRRAAIAGAALSAIMVAVALPVAATGILLPEGIPSTRSTVPTVPEWNGVTSQVDVPGGGSLGCEAKVLREWLRVSCRGSNTTGGTPQSVEIRACGGNAYTHAEPNTRVTSVVMPVIKGQRCEALFCTKDARRGISRAVARAGRRGVRRRGAGDRYRRLHFNHGSSLDDVREDMVCPGMR